jgi:nitrogen fixation protein FixH
MCALAGCSGAASSSEAELMLQAQAGPFAGTLTIEPPHVGAHRVVLVLNESAEGSVPLEGALVMLSPWMPAHGHGSSDVEAHEEEPGVYVADDVWLNMPGIWDLRVRVDAKAQGDLTATIEVP